VKYFQTLPLLLGFIFFIVSPVKSQVGIGTNAPTSKLEVVGAGTTSATTALKVSNANSPILTVRNDGLVEVSTTSQGLLLPRLTTSQRNAMSSPMEGMVIYNTTTGKFQGFAISSTLAISTLDAEGTYVGVDNYPAQTFQVTSSSSSYDLSFWVRALVNGFTTGDIIFELRQGLPGGGGSLLYTQNLSINSVGKKTLNIRNVSLSTATTYHFLLKPLSSYATGSFTVSRSAGNPPGDYASGSLYYYYGTMGPSGAWIDSQGDDLKFEIISSSWVDLH
jgi:hypothetical protein